MPDLVEPPNLSDQQLVQQTLTNPEQFAHLVRRYEIRLRKYVYRLGLGISSVDDVLQETFLQTYLHINGYDPARPFAPWLWRIAYTQTMMHLRKNKSHRLELAGDDAEKLLASVAIAGTVERILNLAEVQRILAQTLADLSEKPRNALILRFLEDCSYLEIAEILRLPVGTVATHIHRGLRDLKELLRKRGFATFTCWTLP